MENVPYQKTNAMASFITRQIGQPFQDGKVTLVVVASDSCKDCYYYLKQKCWSSRELSGLCSEERADRIQSIFIRRSNKKCETVF